MSDFENKGVSPLEGEGIQRRRPGEMVCSSYLFGSREQGKSEYRKDG